MNSRSTPAMPRVVALVSSWCEGPMVLAAVRSAAALDGVLVYDAPVEHAGESGPPTLTPAEESTVGGRPRVRVFSGRDPFPTDAAKRTAMLERARRLWPGPLWGLWLDADEVLLWGEHLHDWLWRVEQQGDDDNPVGGWPLPLVELDGSVAICAGKLVRLDLIRRYLVSSSYIELTNGQRRTVGNMLYWTVPGGPQVESWRARPPLQGEPHLQHRPILRSRMREVERQHVAEARNYQGVELDASNGSG